MKNDQRLTTRVGISKVRGRDRRMHMHSLRIYNYLVQLTMIAADTVAMSLTSFCNPGTLSVVGLLPLLVVSRFVLTSTKRQLL